MVPNKRDAGLPKYKIQKYNTYSEKSIQEPLDMWVKDISDRFYERTGVKMSEGQLGVLESALKFRKEKYDDWETYPGSIFDDIIGVYSVVDYFGDQYLIEISNEPMHVLTRTTGRPGYSCEQISEHWWLGPFHDVALANATAYFFDAVSNQWLGRVNMRWCVTRDGEVDIGIDPNIYPMGLEAATWRDDIILMQALYQIVSDAGYLNYDQAATPYIYKGHSDTTISGNVRLPYQGLKNSKP